MRIFDTFPFDAELDLLEHRLAETYELVDAFVIVEAAQTYSGAPKQLTFATHRDRFAWASPKLRPITLGTLGNGSPRERAAIQRDAARLGLHDAEPDDVVLLFDADEVASPTLLRDLRTRGIDTPRRVLMTRHYQFADAVAPHSPCCISREVPLPYLHPGDWRALDSRWHSASGVVVPWSALAAGNAYDLRFGDIDTPPMTNGGRHFSSVDPSTQLERKLHRVFHTEWAGARETSPAHLALCRAHGVHHLGWWYSDRPQGIVPDDVARLIARIGSAPAFPPLPRRRLARAWARLRLEKWIPDQVVRAVDRWLTRVLRRR